MRIIQFLDGNQQRRLGSIDGELVRDLTAVNTAVTRTTDAFFAAEEQGVVFGDFLAGLAAEAPAAINYQELWEGTEGKICSPVDHADPAHVLLAGTGLTHLGSMKSRNQMHTEENAEPDEAITDSKKIFQMGIEAGKPDEGQRGVAPEWFYKGNGANLRAHGDSLDLPAFALDGGEEAEVVGCYVIDKSGTPRRLGFALGNEWSDHATERINYLYLAPSKLRTCAVGPELVTDCTFQEINLRCEVRRGSETIYESGWLLSGEEHMCHSLANCEDHHFKYPQHRQPGDVHLHYFGTSMLSFSTRDWKYQDGDEIVVEAPDFSKSLINTVRATERDVAAPYRVAPA